MRHTLPRMTSASSDDPSADVRRALGAFDVALRASKNARSNPASSEDERASSAARACVDALMQSSARVRVDAVDWWRAVDACAEEGASGRAFGVWVMAAHARGAVAAARERGSGGAGAADADASEDAATGEARAAIEAWEREMDVAFVARAVEMLASGRWCEEDGSEAEVADVARGASELWGRGRGGDADGRTCAEAIRAARARALAGREGCVTPYDAALLRVCLKAKAYDVAVESGALDANALEVDTRAGVDALDYVSRCYYGGRMWLVLGRYDEAVRWLGDAVAVPGTALSAVSAAAYKKYVLATLLSRSEKTRADTLPSGASNAMNRFASSRELEAYSDLVRVMSRNSLDELNATTEKHAATYEADGNVGLVRLLRERVQIARVRALVKTYSKLKLVDVARLLELPSAEDAREMLVGMASRGDVAARIDDAAGVAEFTHAAEVTRYGDLQAELNRRLRASTALDAKIREENAKILQSRAYVQRVLSEGKKAAQTTRVDSSN